MMPTARGANSPSGATTLSPGIARISVEAQTRETTAPLLFTTDVLQTLHVTLDEVSAEASVSFHILQGRPDVLTLRLVGTGDVTSVTGTGLRDWAVRQGTGPAAAHRFLDIRPVVAGAGEGPRDVAAKVLLRVPVQVAANVALPLLTGGEASAFNWHGRVEPGRDVDLNIVHTEEVVPLASANPDDRAVEFVSHAVPAIQCRVVRRGAAVPAVEFTQLQLEGRVEESAASVAFHLKGAARVVQAGARLRVLSGLAGLSGVTAGDGWHTELSEDGDDPGYDLVFDRKGTIPIAFDFAAAIRRQDDWRTLDFHLLGGNVVPVSLSGLDGAVAFDPNAALVLTAGKTAWQGFLPANGSGALRWKKSAEKVEAALFFTSTEESEIRVAAGLLREVSQLHFRVMQGKLGAVSLRIDGPGEIVGVDGTNIVGWHVVSEGNARHVEIRLSRPMESEGVLTVRSQNVLADFPVRAEPLRLTPEGGVRHAGYVRVANSGAVRLEVTETDGMMQLAPAQYPGTAIEAGARQVFVYRFPSGARRFAILASQIVAEVGVSQITTYAVGETDHVIESDVELEVREAPLREWIMGIPSDFAVVGVEGADVSDYRAETAREGETRKLHLMFGRPVLGRELVHLRLEKNQPAAAGTWRLVPLQFPDAKSVRGHVGVIAASGFRIVPDQVEQLSEIPLSLFPRQTSGLQQAFRIREAGWSAALRVEALGQSIQADVFHLYSVKPGAVAASVLINYFVVGAPASECRIAVPADAGNIDVTGQGMRRDWRREGDVIIVALHQPVLGALTLLVTFEQPLSARGGVIRAGEVRPLQVHAERGYIELASALELQTQVVKAEGNLLKLEPLELPPELRLLATAPALATYQYTARPFALELNLRAYAPGDTVDQVIDFAKFSSEVARDGQVVTYGRLFVKTRGRKMLRLQLPAGVKLWEARVDGELVTPRADDGWTVLPLSAHLNPNDPVPVVLRFGQAATSGRSIELMAPRTTMPLVIGEWTVRSDRDRLLVPRGGTADLTSPNLTENGFEWVSNRDRTTVIVLVLMLALAALVSRVSTLPGRTCAWIAVAGAAGLAFFLADEALNQRRPNRLELTYASSVVPADAPVSIRVANLPTWQAMLSPQGLAAMALGTACLAVGALRGQRRQRGAGWMITVGGIVVAAGLLAQRGGAIFFFGSIAATLAVIAVVLALRLAGVAWTAWKARTRGAGGSAASTVVPALMIGLFTVFMLARGTEARAQTSDVSSLRVTPQSITQRWEIRDHRLFATADVLVRGGPGDSFLLLQPPALLTGFTGDGLHIAKIERGDRTLYYVVPDRTGPLIGHATYELPVSDLSKGVPVLTGPAAVQRISVQLDEAGWAFDSPAAVQVATEKSLPAGSSGATLVLGTGGDAVINLTPERRDASTEATRFFAELTNLYTPGAGVVNASVRVTIRPAQGRVSLLHLRVPDGFSVGDVTNGPIGGWRFDPGTGQLHVTVEPAQSDTFHFNVELQRAASALPLELTLRPLRVEGAAGEFGSLAVACGAEAQPERVQPAGMSAMSSDDFDRSLLPRGTDHQPLATVQAAFRYRDQNASLALRVVPVEPEVRVVARELLSLGDDRLVLAADLNLDIARVGLFQLSFALPAGLDVEAVSGAALSHWTEAKEDQQRVITLHLNGRTLGAQTFAVTLSGPPPAFDQPWTVPQLRLREATRQTGDLQVVPARGIRLRPVERVSVAELDPRTIGDARPGMLAFRMLDETAKLTLGIEALEPWVTVQALQEVTTREGQTLTRVAMHYRVENAAVKRFVIAIPELSPEQMNTVHATGAAVSDLVPVPGSPGRWEIRLQRGVIGEADVQLEFQATTAPDKARQSIVTPNFPGVRQVEQFVALRSGGRLELELANVPRGWERVDWSAVPANLQDRSDHTVPALAFRVAEPEKPLEVTVRRHGIADALKLRVTAAQLLTLFSPQGTTLTAVDLQVAVAEKSQLRIRLPEHAVLFNTFLNGDSVAIVRDGEDYLFHVSANTANEPAAKIHLVYAVTPPPAAGVVLEGPRLNIPLENVTWRAVLPPGYTFSRYEGTLRLTGGGAGGSFDLGDYEAAVAMKRSADTKRATDFLQAASALLQQGQGQKAGEVLMRAARDRGLDEASNEDARVQLRTLRTQQTVVGLNTRRQRLYLGNNADAFRNEQLEQAANLNPVMRGKLDFDPQQLDQLLMGNSVEENTALRGIAARMVDQQLAAEPATTAIDVTLPERGKVVTFVRSLQVNGNAPLELRLTLDHENRTRPAFALLILGSLGVLAGLWIRTGNGKPSRAN